MPGRLRNRARVATRIKNSGGIKEIRRRALLEEENDSPLPKDVFVETACDAMKRADRVSAMKRADVVQSTTMKTARTSSIVDDVGRFLFFDDWDKCCWGVDDSGDDMPKVGIEGIKREDGIEHSWVEFRSGFDEDGETDSTTDDEGARAAAPSRK